MTYRVLISCPYFLPVVENYRTRLEGAGCELLIADVVERLDEEQLLPLVGDINGALCGDDAYNERVIAAAPRLRVIAKWGTGIDSIDQQAASARGIAVCNTPNAFTEPVADTVLGYLLSFARRLPWMDHAMKGGEWKKIPGRTLGECTLGIIGVGNIGKAVARRARAFSMKVLGNDIRDDDPEWREIGIEMVSRDRLLDESDFVSLNCDLRRGNRHLISKTELGRMKPTSVLINTARGPLIDEVALTEALRKDRLAGVALDVFEREPLPHTSPLLSCDRAMLAPHNSNSSPRAWEAVHESTVTQLLDKLRTNP